MAKINRVFLLLCFSMLSCSKTSSHSFYEMPVFTMNSKDAFIVEVYRNFDKNGEDVHFQTSNNGEMTIVDYGPIFKKHLSEDEAQILEKEEIYHIGYSYEKDDISFTISYGLLTDFDIPQTEDESKWFRFETAKTFGKMTEIELIDNSFSLPSFEKEIKFIGIEILFQTPTYGSGVFGFLISNE